MDVIWINPVVKGSCTPNGGCGSICCKVKVYTDSVNYTTKWCDYYNQDPTVTLKCMNYDNRYEGCQRYPTPVAMITSPAYDKCGYYLEEAA